MLKLPKTIDTFGVWTQYTNFRFKEPHDILLKDGYLLLSAYPNGAGWSLRGDDKQSWELFKTYCNRYKIDSIRDSDVVAVRLLTDEDIEKRNLDWEVGKERLNRIHEYHADGRGHVILPVDALVKDDVVREFVNEIRNVCVKYGATQQLRAHVSRLTKTTFSNLFYNQ